MRRLLALLLLVPACAVPAAGPGQSLAPELQLTHGSGSTTVEVDGEPFATYHHGEHRGPYVHPLFAPGGLAVTRGYPMDPRPDEARDHPHHRSLWFAHGDVNGHDFWHGGDTRVVELVPHPTDAVQDDPARAAARRDALALEGRVQHGFHWLAGDELVTLELRDVWFGADADGRWIDHRSRLARDGELRFGDTKEGTFGLRLAPTLRVQGDVAAGSLLDSEGRVDGEVWGKRARWVAARGPVPGPDGMEDVTVAIFDAPTNPRHPTWWHARTYGLVAANPFGRSHFEGAAPGSGDLVTAGNLVFDYRVWVASGAASPDRIEAAYRAYLTALDER